MIIIPLVEIGLTDLPKSRGAMAPRHPQGRHPCCSLSCTSVSHTLLAQLKNVSVFIFNIAILFWSFVIQFWKYVLLINIPGYFWEYLFELPKHINSLNLHQFMLLAQLKNVSVFRFQYCNHLSKFWDSILKNVTMIRRSTYFVI